MLIRKVFGLQEGTTVHQDSVDLVPIYSKEDIDIISLELKSLIEPIAEVNIPYIHSKSP